MFLGTYLLAFSGKGRIILPKKFRNQLNKPEVFLMRGIDGGIWGFSTEDWLKFSNKQLELSLLERKGRLLRRQFFPFAESCELDDQGRFVISEFLLKEGEIKDRLALIGAGDHFEIWNYNLWLNLVNKGGL